MKKIVYAAAGIAGVAVGGLLIWKVVIPLIGTIFQWIFGIGAGLV